MAQLRTRRTVSRGNTPQSPPRQAAQPSTSTPARRSARSASRDTAISRNQRAVIKPLLTVVLEQDDASKIVEMEEGDATSAVDEAVGDEDADEQVDNNDSDADDDDPELEDESDIASEYDEDRMLEELDRDLIIDSLSAIHQDSTNILSLLSPSALPALVDDIKDVKSQAGKRFRNFKARFDISTEPCGNRNFLAVNLIVRKLAGTRLAGRGLWRPDPILYMANLVIFLSSLIADDNKGVNDTLEYLFNNFPSVTLMGPLNDNQGTTQPYGITDIDATVHLGIAIRTQFFLQTSMRMSQEESFDPDQILRSIFFDIEDGSLRGYEDYRANELMLKKIEAECTKRIQKIRRFFSVAPKRSIDLEGLKEKYPWNDFVSSAFQWAAKRWEELTAHISIHGGVDTIVDGLLNAGNASLSSRQDLIDKQSQPSEVPVTGEIPTTALSPSKNTSIQIDETPAKKMLPRASIGKSKTKSNQIQRLKEIKALRGVAEDDSDASEESNVSRLAKKDRSRDDDPALKAPDRANQRSAQTPRREIPQSPNEQVTSQIEHDPLPDNDDNEQPAEEEVREPTPPVTIQGSLVPTQQTSAVLAVLEKQKVAGNKENVGNRLRYTDRQEGARLVDWDDDDEPRNIAKRPRNAPAEDEDDDFETDTRTHKRSRVGREAVLRRPLARLDSGAGDDAPDPTSDHEVQPPRNTNPPRSTQPAPSRSPRGQPASTNSRPNRPPPSTAPADSRRRARSPSQDLPQATQAEKVQQANSQAKLNSRRFADTSRMVPQVRRKWSADEIERLVELVAIHGTAWAAIKDEDKNHDDGPLLEGRDQVALKDKARNIKMDFLKACQRLPTGFSAVSIKAGDLQKLNELGVPHQGGMGGRGITEDEE